MLGRIMEMGNIVARTHGPSAAGDFLKLVLSPIMHMLTIYIILPSIAPSPRELLNEPKISL